MEENIKKLLTWINSLNEKTKVNIQRNKLSESTTWFYDENVGSIHNLDNSFFSIIGLKGRINGVNVEQPIIIQNEIGYLGIICKKIDDQLKFLMQAKIEPGNINCVQLSPTIQATKSNFMQRHGGEKPNYLEFFTASDKYRIIADQIQSEQSSRFLGKRNRNMIIEINEDIMIEVKKNFIWLTLHEIKELMKYKNIVNMDTRTVLSCLPYMNYDYFDHIRNASLYRSMHYTKYIDEIIEIYHKINDYKMFSDNEMHITKLNSLDNWELKDDEIVCKNEYPFKVIFCDIEIEGREVKRWTQPLFQANGIATFGLIVTEDDGIMKFLVKIQPEIGAFDKIELGPTIQKEAAASFHYDEIEELFKRYLDEERDILFDSILSEEGGRFYHEENRNVIIYINREKLKRLPGDYCLVSYTALNHLNMVNNCLNIQLRNLLSTLEV